MYQEIIALRNAITEEVKLELGQGMPFTIEHQRLVELRLQTALSFATKAMSQEIELLNTQAVQKRKPK